MDPGYRSPLVDLFLRGGATRDVRLLAARGLLPSPAHEQIALLVVLVDDPDPEIAAQAEATISRLPREALDGFLASDVPAELRAFFSSRVSVPHGPAAASGTPRGSSAESSGVAQTVNETGRSQDVAAGFNRSPGDADVDSKSTTEGDLDGNEQAGKEAKEDEDGDPRLVSALPIADRLKLATKGTREQRAQLIRDSNRIVATAVLTSPKLTEAEVEAFAKMGNVSEDVLRIIGTNRNWLKNYSIVHAVTRNPKTPPAISMQLMHRLTEKDIKMLSTDRNVPEALRLAARRVLTKALNK